VLRRDGCENAPRTGSAELCPKHYHRWYRHGSTDLATTEINVSVSHGRRYRLKEIPSHPLAGRNGKVYEHRMVLYDAIGPGPHPCYWCGVTLDWLPGSTPGAIEVDHLNAISDDNRIDNLVPACRNCNSGRGSQARADVLRSLGWWSNHDTIESLGARKPRVEGTEEQPHGEHHAHDDPEGIRLQAPG
jgi:5-methylcytosine-specific restriction endonuclease McrA